MYLLELEICPDICLGVELLDHFSSIFSFLGTCILFALVVAPTYIPTDSVEGIPFLHTLSRICYL